MMSNETKQYKTPESHSTIFQNSVVPRLSRMAVTILFSFFLRAKKKGKGSIVSILFLIIIVSSSLHASERTKQIQSISELREAILDVRGAMNNQNEKYHPGQKCGLWLALEANRLLSQSSDLEKEKIRELLAPQAYQKSRIIGRFQFFYDTSSANAPAMIRQIDEDTYERIPGSYEEFVDSAGRAFNEVWDYEINTLGYPAPPLDGSNFYRVNIRELGFGYYGWTVPTDLVTSFPAQQFRSYIEIENDFINVYSPSRGIPGMKVTAAHEFHHAIQIGGYGSYDDVRYFMEITSTWMEDVVYNDINDYFQYQSNNPTRSSQFSRPELGFRVINGEIEYSRSVWGKYLEKRFSRGLMKRIWELIPTNASLVAMDEALAEAGSTFRKAFVEFSYWNSLTGLGDNTDTVAYYTEGKYYPQMRMKSTVEFTYSARAITDSVQAVSSLYYPICSRSSPGDACGSAIQMKVNIINLNTTTTATWHKFRYWMDTTGDASYKELSNGMFVKLDVPDASSWASFESAPPLLFQVKVYPNPMKSKEKKPLNFRLPSVVQQTAMIYIFSTSMDKVYSGELPVEYPRPLEPIVTWNGQDDNGETIGSGIYIYVIQIDGKDYQGKFAVVKE